MIDAKLYCFVGQRPFVLPAQGIALWIGEKIIPIRPNGPIIQSYHVSELLARWADYIITSISGYQGDALGWENFSPFETANG
jgi:hypothetical protein